MGIHNKVLKLGNITIKGTIWNIIIIITKEGVILIITIPILSILLVIHHQIHTISNNKFRTPNTTNILMDIPIYIPNKLIMVPLEEEVEDQTIVLLALMQDRMILVEMQ